MRLAGEAIDEREAEGGRISDETLLVLMNAFHEDLVFTLPESGGEGECAWERLMDTEEATPPAPSGIRCPVGGTYSLAGRALALFRRVSGVGSQVSG
jgi:glycogen operon protein